MPMGQKKNRKWIKTWGCIADDSVPGVDLILPDAGFIIDKRDDLLGIILTHAHEDHIGSVAHIWPSLKQYICHTFHCSTNSRKVQRKEIDISNILLFLLTRK